MTEPGERDLSIEIEGFDDELTVESVTAEEAISHCFRVVLHLNSPSADLDLDGIVGSPATVRAAFGGTTRLWTGVCSKISCAHAAGIGISSYEADVVPLLWLLSQRTNHRIFQGQTAREIATAIFEEWSLPASWNVDDTAHPRYDYRTQYGESDLDFVTRLLSDDGIAFAFGDEDGSTVLRLSDAFHRGDVAGPAIPFAEDISTVGGRRYSTGVVRSAVTRPAALVLRDFDHRRPSSSVSASAVADTDARRRELHRYDPGTSAVRVDTPDSITPVADTPGGVRHTQDELATRAARELARERFDRRQVRFSTNAAEARAGAVVEISGHPRAELSQGLLVVSSRFHTTVQHPGSILVRAAFADVPFVPPRRGPPGAVHGLQSAIVTGPPGEEIHTDEFGRVKVRFPWDRSGRVDDRSSCWVRVSQGWAGGGYGLLTIPRVGHEVLVAFVDGDPDNPVIVGSLHNGLQPHVHRLPENKTVSSLRTSSSPGGGGWNELRFEDRSGDEHVLLRAQRDMEAAVVRDYATHVGANWSSTVGGNRVSAVAGDRASAVTGDEIRTVLGSASTTVSGNETHEVRGTKTNLVRGAHLLTTTGITREEHIGEVRREARADVIERVEGNHVVIVGRASAQRSFATHVDGDLRTTVTEHIEIRADRELVLVCGKSEIRLGPEAIEIRSPSVGVHGEDARLRLASGELKAYAKTKAQIRSDEVLVKSDGASLKLTSEAKLGGSKVKLGPDSDGTDSVDEAPAEPTVIELIDDMGDPIPNQPFRIRLASGAELTGALDGKGRAELDLAEGGEIEFPGLHKATEE